MSTITVMPSAIEIPCEKLNRKINLPIWKWVSDRNFDYIAHYWSELCACGSRHFGPAYFDGPLEGELVWHGQNGSLYYI